MMVSVSGLNSFKKLDSTISSRAGNSFNVDEPNLLTGELYCGKNSDHSGPGLQFHQPYGNEREFQGLHLQTHQLFANESFMCQDTRHLSPETDLNKNKDTYSLTYQYGGDYDMKRNTSSNSCRYSIKGPIETKSTRALPYQTFKLPSYDIGAYPLTVQVHEVFQSININMLSERPMSSANENDAIQGTCSPNKPNENYTRANQDLPESTQQTKGDINNNQELDSKIHQAPGNGSISSNLCKNGSDINQERHLHFKDSSVMDSSSNPNTTPPFPMIESSSNESFSLSCSESPKCESNGTDCSTPVTFQLPDGESDIIIKDLHLSRSRQLANISVKIEGLYSPKKLIRNKFQGSQDLHPLADQSSKIEASEIQKSDQIIDQLSQNNTDRHQITNSQALQLHDYKCNTSEDFITVTKKISENDPQTVHVGASIKNQSLNLLHQNKSTHKPQSSSRKPLSSSRKPLSSSRKPLSSSCKPLSLSRKPPSSSRTRFVTLEELHELLSHLSNSGLNKPQGLYPEYSIEVNIFIVGLGDSIPIRLIKTFATFSKWEIPNTFGWVFATRLSLAGIIPLIINCWQLENSADSTRVRTFSVSSRNVFVLMYDVTQFFDGYALRTEIEFLKFTSCPILLFGNTSDVTDALPPGGSKIRLVQYKDGCLIRDVYKLSSFFEFSVESENDVDGLFLTAIDLAFRNRM